RAANQATNAGTGFANAQKTIGAATDRVAIATRTSSEATQQASRVYRNASTAVDAMISSREREAKVFSSSLRARLQGEQKAAEAVERNRERERIATEKAQARTLASYERTARAIDASERRSARAAEARYTAALRQTNALKAAQRRSQMSAWDSEFKALSRVAAATARASKEQSGYNDITARYVSYDMAGTLLTVAGAITAVGAATAVAFAQQERAFTEVERILGIDPNVDVSSIQRLRE